MIIKDVTIDAETVEEIRALGATDEDFERWVLRAHDPDAEIYGKPTCGEGWQEGKVVWKLRWPKVYGEPDVDDAIE